MSDAQQPWRCIDCKETGDGPGFYVWSGTLVLTLAQLGGIQIHIPNEIVVCYDCITRIYKEIPKQRKATKRKRTA